VSRGIQLVSHSDVSHALIALGPDELWDAMDFAGNLDEKGGGARPVDMRRYFSGSGLRRIELLRLNTPVDPVSLRAAVYWVAAQDLPFASVGVCLEALLVLSVRTQLMLGRFAPHMFESWIDRLGDVVGDGEKRVVCGEFIYRSLGRAGVDLRFTDSMLMRAFDHVPRPEVRTENALDRGVTVDATLDALKRAAEQSASTRWAASDHSTLTRFWEGPAAMFRSTMRRIHEYSPPEQIDFITPSDFHFCPQLNQFLTIARHGEQWVRVP
jgi:hypothetical protein